MNHPVLPSLKKYIPVLPVQSVHTSRPDAPITDVHVSDNVSLDVILSETRVFHARHSDKAIKITAAYISPTVETKHPT